MTLALPTLVRCQAIVDPANADAERRLQWGSAINNVHPLWRVTARGLPPHHYERVWLIPAADDTLAADEGIRRFVAEAEGATWQA